MPSRPETVAIATHRAEAAARTARVAFAKRAWLAASDAKTNLERGGFGEPKPPLFPGEGGRHRQRAYRDALADLLPGVHGWLPTLASPTSRSRTGSMPAAPARGWRSYSTVDFHKTERSVARRGLT